jgi:hypothetical protein
MESLKLFSERAASPDIAVQYDNANAPGDAAEEGSAEGLSVVLFPELQPAAAVAAMAAAAASFAHFIFIV